MEESDDVNDFYFKTFKFYCITFYSVNCVIFTKKAPLLWFCKFLCPEGLRICFSLNRDKS